MSEQITSISFFRFSSLKNQFWALKMMQLAHKDLGKVKGQQFYRLLGSGKGKGFNPFPDWSVYAMLQVWDNEAAADAYFNHSEVWKSYKDRSSEQCAIYMKNLSAAGAWMGGNPFEVGTKPDENQAIAVITRATIKWKYLRKFWSYVPHSQKALEGNNGLIYTKGVGEWPLVQMATFSLWKDLESVKQFAYKNHHHREAIRKTRQYDWYKEELFARFHPYKMRGTWQGKHLL